MDSANAFQIIILETSNLLKTNFKIFLVILKGEVSAFLLMKSEMNINI